MSDKPSDHKAESVAAWIGDSFLRIARELREVQDENPELFASVAEYCGTGLRKAYYLARIDRQFQDLGIEEGRLRAIGWSKLRLICDHVTNKNCEWLLKLAELCTVRELEMRMRDSEPVVGTHWEPVVGTRCVTLYFEPDEYEIFASAILHHGGLKSGRGLVDKEKALVKALSSIKS